MKALILAWLLTLPVYAEDRGDPRKPEQLGDIASAIDDVSGNSRQVAALLGSIGWNETGWSLRIHDGHCRSWECDHGRARGPWQSWRNSMPAEQWDQMRGLENTRTQAETARARILLGLQQCNGSVWGALARYIGKPCDARSPLLDDRFKWYRRAYRALDPNREPSNG